MKLIYNPLGGREKGWGYTHDFNVPLTNTRKTTSTVLHFLSRMACGIYCEGNTNVKTLELGSLRSV
jgi:hypothetical protein